MDEVPLGRCIGLIGGLGVGAAIHYYRELARVHTERGHVLNLIMAHADLDRVRSAVAAGDKQGLASYLAVLIQRMKAAGAEFAVLPAVAPHIAIAELIELSPLPLVNLIAELKREIDARRLRRIGLLGTRYVVESRLYGQLENVDIVMPRPDEIDYIHATYFQVAEAGVSTAAHDGLTRLAHTLIKRDGAEAIVLAGTDLALVFNDTNTDFPHIDAARVHLNAIIQRATDPRV
jgi:aspartate racemase